MYPHENGAASKHWKQVRCRKMNGQLELQLALNPTMTMSLTLKSKSKGTNLQNKNKLGSERDTTVIIQDMNRYNLKCTYYGTVSPPEWRIFFIKCRKNNHKNLEWLKLSMSRDNKLGRPANLFIEIPVIKTILQQMHFETLGGANTHTSYANNSCNQIVDHPNTLMRCQF